MNFEEFSQPAPSDEEIIADLQHKVHRARVSRYMATAGEPIVTSWIYSAEANNFEPKAEPPNGNINHPAINGAEAICRLEVTQPA